MSKKSSSLTIKDLPDDVLSKIVSNLPKTGRQNVKAVNKEFRHIANRANEDSPVKSPKTESWEHGKAKRYHVKLPKYPSVMFGVVDVDMNSVDSSNLLYEAWDVQGNTLFSIEPIPHKHIYMYQIIVLNMDFYNNPHWIKMVIQEAFEKNKGNPQYTKEVYMAIITGGFIPSLNLMVELKQPKPIKKLRT